MAKVVKFPVQPPEKFGFEPVRKKKAAPKTKESQLDLFQGGKLVRLSQLSPFEEALLLDEQGHPEARALYQKAIEAGDSAGDAYCNMGILESQEKNFSKAIDCFTLALKLEPRHFEAHYNLANLYAELGNFPLAKVHYQISIEIEPDFTNSHFNLGLTLAMNKEIEEAILSLMRYRRLSSEDEHSHVDELINNLSRIV